MSKDSHIPFKNTAKPSDTDCKLPNSTPALSMKDYKEITLHSSNGEFLSLYQSKTNKCEVWAITKDMSRFLRVCGTSLQGGVLILIFCDSEIPAITFRNFVNAEELSSALEMCKHIN